MNSYNIYSDIAKRTNGDIYVGVVGPVRTGKSTFIRNVLSTLVIPNIMDVNDKERAIDEMPQSGDGKSIMTTQPKFIPNEAVKITVNENVEMSVRLIDCVGYMVEGALGHEEENKPRLVKTPWSEDELPFAVAAELGTNKVISNHSTIGVLLTTDGSVTDLDRFNYVKAEEQVYEEMIKCNKPFVIVLNTQNPFSEETKKLVESLENKYSKTVIPMDVSKLSEEDVSKIFASVLSDFPLVSVEVEMPKWLQALPFDNKYIQEIVTNVYDIVNTHTKIGDFNKEIMFLADSENFEPTTEVTIEMGEGKVRVKVNPKPELFYKVLSEECGCDIKSDYHLVSYVKQLTEAKVQYDKFKDALLEVEQTGYGVVRPTINDMILEAPQMVKQGGRFGIKLKATAPSLHLMKVDIQTEVNPIVGTEQQSEELVKYLMSEYETDPNSVWESKLFGKTLSSMVSDGLQTKLVSMPVEVQKKIRKTLGRIVNEGKGGVICILL